MPKKNDKYYFGKYAAPFREYAGVLCAFITVMAFIAIGFGVMSAEVFLGTNINVPSDWMAAMLSLASAALGYLIGKQNQMPSEPQMIEPPAENAVCELCGRENPQDLSFNQDTKP